MSNVTQLVSHDLKPLLMLKCLYSYHYDIYPSKCAGYRAKFLDELYIIADRYINNFFSVKDMASIMSPKNDLKKHCLVVS